MEEKSVIVVDNGSGEVKAGFAGESKPRTEFPNIVGRPKNIILTGVETKDSYLGVEALKKRAQLKITHPVQNGIVQNWEDMEKIWRHIFNELRVQPDENPILITEGPLNPRQNREKMAEIMFETFGVPNLFAVVPAVLSIISTGKWTGLVCDVGFGAAHTVPVYEGFAVHHAIKAAHTDLSGHHLNTFMGKLLKLHSHDQMTPEMLDAVKEIKEKCTKVALDYRKTYSDWEERVEDKRRIEAKKIEEQKDPTHKRTSKEVKRDIKREEQMKEELVEYALPDGNKVQFDIEKYQCPELLFQPDIFHEHKAKKITSLPDLLYKSVKRCDVDVRRRFYKNIVVSGGSTLFEGFAERLVQEVEARVDSKTLVKLRAPEKRRIAAWRGGSAWTQMHQFQSMWIGKEDYDEYGASVIHRKCV